MTDLDVISDLSYAWVIMTDFIRPAQARISDAPDSVSLLRAMFLKLTSVLDSPLVRIFAADSPDLVSVSEHYSSELVNYVRKVLEVVPRMVFQLLGEITKIQATRMKRLPVKLPLVELADIVQPEERFTVARMTHRISVFTEDTLSMEKTLLGVIQVDPRQILNEGIRKHLVQNVTEALHSMLQFDLRTGRNRDPKVCASEEGLEEEETGAYECRGAWATASSHASGAGVCTALNLGYAHVLAITLLRLHCVQNWSHTCLILVHTFYPWPYSGPCGRCSSN